MRFERLGRRLVAVAVTLLATVAGFGASRIAARRRRRRRAASRAAADCGDRALDSSAMAADRSGRPEFEEREAEFSTMSGHPIEPLYGPEDAPADPEETIGRPGEYPFTRGPYASMYRGGSGRCASSPASARSRRPTSASTTCSTTARPASRPPSTCRP